MTPATDLPTCAACGQPLRLPETRAAGRCLACLDPDTRRAVIQALGARRRAAWENVRLFDDQDADIPPRAS